METLVLNKACQPIRRVSWQKAIGQWVKGKVEIIDSYLDKIIYLSKNLTLYMPSIVRELTDTIRPRGTIKFSRDNVYARDKGKCQYCSKFLQKYESTYDHVIPRVQGGKTTWANIVIACEDCNRKKGGRTPEQARMKLQTKPIKPRSLPNINKSLIYWTPDMPYSWKDWLYEIRYLHSELEEE